MTEQVEAKQLLIGVDTGGTFTDLVMVAGREVRTWKLPSTPDDPSRAVLEGIRHLAGERGGQVCHGSTVATNALLEGKVAAVALVTTAGFRDLLEIGRQARSSLYALEPSKNAPLVPRQQVIEVAERILADGQVETALPAEALARAVDQVLATGCHSVAVCLLHAYTNPDHELRLERALTAAGLQVSTSHRILPEFREFERAATTAVNASVSPIMNRYLEQLESGLQNRTLRIMQSNGGAISADTAGREAVRTILSGPAGGLVGAFAAGRRAGMEKLITFDMGGTSTDVALCDGELPMTTETEIAGWPIKVPMIDIHTVGAGGGSIARLDAAGALRVGPQSAGADPGPICYGRGGDKVTVTDANLFLGRLLADRFLGGRMRLAEQACRTAVEKLAGQADIAPERLAAGILEVAEERMAAALRVVSVQQGHDPRDFTLLPFGGAGGLHACALAEKLGIARILLPAYPGLLSAVGMVLADVIRDYSRSVLGSERIDEERLEAEYRRLEEQAVREMAAEGISGNQLVIERALDLRYRGQSFEITVPATDNFAAAFHLRHEELYGYQAPDRPVEIVTLRLRAIGPGPEIDLMPPQQQSPGERFVHRLVMDGEAIDCPVFSRPALRASTPLQGPALILEETATHLVRQGWQVRPDALGNLVLERRQAVSQSTGSDA